MTVKHQVGRGGAFGELAAQLEADDLRNEHRHRLPEHGRLGFDAADAPAEAAQAVDHRGVGIGADERVGIKRWIAPAVPSFMKTTRARYSRFT